MSLAEFLIVNLRKTYAFQYHIAREEKLSFSASRYRTSYTNVLEAKFILLQFDLCMYVCIFCLTASHSLSLPSSFYISFHTVGGWLFIQHVKQVIIVLQYFDNTILFLNTILLHLLWVRQECPWTHEYSSVEVKTNMKHVIKCIMCVKKRDMKGTLESYSNNNSTSN